MHLVKEAQNRYVGQISAPEIWVKKLKHGSQNFGRIGKIVENGKSQRRQNILIYFLFRVRNWKQTKFRINSGKALKKLE